MSKRLKISDIIYFNPNEILYFLKNLEKVHGGKVDVRISSFCEWTQLSDSSVGI